MICVCSSTTSLLALFLFLFCVLEQSDASIRIEDIGVEYLSRPDKYVGLQMKTGIEYDARLQRVPRERDSHLCGTEGFNVTVPDDGRPVALLVNKGFCSYAQKAEFASRNIHPLGIVKVLIIDGETRIMDQQNGKHKSYFQKEATKRSEDSTSLSSYEFPNYYNFSNSTNNVVTLRRKHANDISVVLLHVSYETGVELLELIGEEEASVKYHGGTIVTVDATTPPINQTIIMIWTALCVVLSVVACCCLANVMEDFYDAQQPEPDPPRRPRRNRLTLEQVQKMPVGIFDGHQLVYADEESSIEQQTTDYEQKPSTVFLQPSESTLQDACTICLDDYEIGDKLRCLPCGHAFHANCIAKWLIERSATCPLCNKDLYEEEESDNEDEDEEAGEIIDETIPTETSATEDDTREGETSTREPWWRNIFRRRERREEFGEGLAEPLLQEQVEEEPQAQSSSAASESVDEEEPTSDESNEEVPTIQNE